MLMLNIGLLAMLQAAPDSLVSFDGRRAPAEQVVVPADYAVTFLRLPGASATPSSPIVFLMGGPGVPATIIGRIPPYFTLFNDLRRSADVILLDQRGVGRSTPTVDCRPVNPPSASFLASLDDLRQALVSAYAPCVAGWRARGQPAESIGVRQVAEDIERIRIHLGVPTVSLLGFSYGSRIALEYALRYPGHVDRIVLQGVLGFEHGVRLPTTLDSLLDRVSEAAKRDATASGLVGDLRASMAGVLQQLDRSSVSVPVASGADTVWIPVGGGGFRALVSTGLASPRLPALLATLEKGDTRVLAQMVGSMYRDLASGGGSMFGRAIYCSATPSAERANLARRLAGRTLLGETFDNIPPSAAFCRDIGINPVPAATAPARLGGTALLIEGTLDDRTPLGNARETARLFNNASVVMVENGGHELLPADDVRGVVTEFFSSGRVPVARLRLPVPRYETIEEAVRPPRRPGQ